MRITTVLRRVLGVTQMFVKQVELSVTGALLVSVAPVAVRALRREGAAVRPSAGAGVASPAVGPDAGVVALCAVAGLVPAVRRAGRTGVVGGGVEGVHGAV